jgi:hypothetical protein
VNDDENSAASEPEALAGMVEPTQDLAARILAFCDEILPEREPRDSAILVAALELCRWRLLDDGDVSESVRAMAIEIFESAAGAEISASDLEEIDAMVRAWSDAESAQH